MRICLLALVVLSACTLLTVGCGKDKDKDGKNNAAAFLTVRGV
jgi:hypothetical protein